MPYITEINQYCKNCRHHKVVLSDADEVASSCRLLNKWCENTKSCSHFEPQPKYNYCVWPDGESKDQFSPMYFDTLEEAEECAGEHVHQFDYTDTLSIAHVEDIRKDETIDTVESLKEGINC